jgi:hypothetical protein
MERREVLQSRVPARVSFAMLPRTASFQLGPTTQSLGVTVLRYRVPCMWH